MSQGEEAMQNLEYQRDIKHEAVMEDASSKFRDFATKYKEKPDYIKETVIKAAAFLTSPDPIPEEENEDIKEVAGILRQMYTSFKEKGGIEDEQTIVAEIIQKLGPKTIEKKLPGGIELYAKQIGTALRDIEPEAPGEKKQEESKKEFEPLPLEDYRKFKPEVLDKHTTFTSPIKPHERHIPSDVITAIAVGVAAVGAGSLYGVVSTIDVNAIIGDIAKGFNIGGEVQQPGVEKKVDFDRKTAETLYNYLTSGKPASVYDEVSWGEFFHRTGDSEAAVILVKYYSPDWWKILLTKIGVDAGQETARIRALQGIATALDEKVVNNDFSSLKKYVDNPDRIWSRLYALRNKIQYTEKNWLLYKIITNPDPKVNDFQQFLDWQNNKFDSIRNNNRKLIQDVQSVSMRRVQPKESLKFPRISTAIFLSAFASHPQLLDSVREMIGENETITETKASSILNDPNIKSRLSRREFLRLSSQLIAGAITRRVGF